MQHINYRGQRPEDLIRSQFCKPEVEEKLRKYTNTEELEQQPGWQEVTYIVRAAIRNLRYAQPNIYILNELNLHLRSIHS